jgi:hypothetical protein
MTKGFVQNDYKIFNKCLVPLRVLIFRHIFFSGRVHLSYLVNIINTGYRGLWNFSPFCYLKKAGIVNYLTLIPTQHAVKKK